MSKSYPMELRLRAIHFVNAGQSRHQVAKRLGAVSFSFWRLFSNGLGTGAPVTASQYENGWRDQ